MTRNLTNQPQQVPVNQVAAKKTSQKITNVRCIQFQTETVVFHVI